MTIPWETVRIFISSTFDDMHAERDYLVKQVFPELREWCEWRKLRLVDIDLRWGVKEEDTQNKNVVEACLRRIDEARPFFLCFLGQRRGWAPGPQDISPATLADNAYPDLKETIGKASVTELEILHALVSPFHSNRQGKTQPDEFYQPVKYALFYLRDPAYLAQLPVDFPALSKVYTNAGIPDEADRREADRQLQRWTEVDIPEMCEKHRRPQRCYQATWQPEASTPELLLPLACPSSAPENIRQWQNKWAEAGLQLNGVEMPASQRAQAEAYNQHRTRGRLGNFTCDGKSLRQVLLEDLQTAIVARYPQHVELTAETGLQRELDQQEQFLFSAGEGFIERGGVFDDLDAYVQGKDRQILVLAAPGGIGKTALLAKWIDRYRTQWNGKSGHSLHYRFIGQSDGATTVHALLQSLVREIKERHLHTRPSVRRDPQALRQEWQALLETAGANSTAEAKGAAEVQAKTVIVLDGLNQLESGLTDLDWLPLWLPQCVKLIVSFKSGEVGAEVLPQQWAGKVTLSTIQPFESLSHRRLLVNTYLSEYLKQIDEPLLEALIQSPGAANPLYLKVVLSELRVFGAFANLAEKIRSAFGETPVSAFQAVLTRMENDPAFTALDPRQAIPLLFGLLVHARHGLSVEELSDLFVRALGCERQAALDTLHLYLRQVRPFLAQRNGRFDFFFESFKLAAEQRYTSQDVLTPARPAQEWHARLAQYFGELPMVLPGAHARQNLRKLAETPYHQTMAEQWHSLFVTLTDFDFLQAKSRFMSEFELETDYQLALQRWNGSDGQKKVIAAFGERLRLDSNIIDLHPELLFCCLYNHLTWLDAPEGPIHRVCEAARQSQKNWLRLIQDPRPEPPPIPLELAGHTRKINHAVVLPNGQQVVSASSDHSLKLWDLESGKVVLSLESHVGPVRVLTVTPDGERVISGSDDMKIKVWDLATGQLLRTMDAHTSPVTALAVSPDGRLAVSGAGHHMLLPSDKLVKVWDLTNGRLVRTLRGHTGSVNAVAVTPDGRFVLSGSDDKTVKVWELDSGKLVTTLKGHKDWVRAVAIMPDGQHVLTGSKDVLSVWDLANGRVTNTFAGHTYLILSIVVTANGQYALLGTTHGLETIELTGLTALPLYRDSGEIGAVAVTPNQRQVIYTTGDPELKVRDLSNPKPPRRLAGAAPPTVGVSTSQPGAGANKDTTLRRAIVGHAKAVYNLAVTPNERQVVSASWDKTLKVWDIVNGRLVRVLEGLKDGVNCAAVTPDGRYLLSAGSGIYDQTIKVWDLSSGTLLRSIPGSQVGVYTLTFTPDGEQFVSASGDDVRKIKVWDFASGQIVKSFECFGRSRTLALTPDGRLLVAGTFDGQIKAWRLSDGELLHLLQEPLRKPLPLTTTYNGELEILATVIPAHGRHVLSGSRDGLLRQWDLESGRLLGEWKETGPVCALLITPDGRQALAAVGQSLKLWELETGVSQFLFVNDTPIHCINWTKDQSCVVCGDDKGRVWMFEWVVPNPRGL